MTGAELAPLELAGRLALAFGLAVFLGLAFEEVYKREDRSSPGGVRTFPMLAVSGAMLYLIEPQHALAFIAGLFPLALWLHAYLRSAPPSPNATSLMIPVSNLLAYVIGPVAVMQPPWMVVTVSVTAVILLGTREQLHRLIQVVPQDELLTAGTFLILIGIILPLVPNQPITAATTLTPYHVWLAVVAVCTLSYLSYLLQKYVSASNAALLPAILGGLYSSTATTGVLAKRQREVGLARSDLAAGIVAATAVMYVRLAVVIALFNMHLASALAPALGALFAFGAGLATYEWRRIAELAARCESQRSRHQSTANTHGVNLCCDLCHRLRGDGLDSHDIWPNRCVGLGGCRWSDRHRSIRDQYRARRGDGFIYHNAFCGHPHSGFFKQRRESDLCHRIWREILASSGFSAGRFGLLGFAAAAVYILLLAISNRQAHWIALTKGCSNHDYAGRLHRFLRLDRRGGARHCRARTPPRNRRNGARRVSSVPTPRKRKGPGHDS